MYNNPVYKYLKKRFKTAVHALGYDVQRYSIFTSEEVQMRTFLNYYNIRSILDVGANEGQFASKLFETGFSGAIHSFEPIPSVYQKLAQHAARQPGWKTYPFAMGRESGESMINVSANFASSSLLEVEKSSTSVEPATRTTHREKINITTIDSFIRDNPTLERNVLLKLDIQGFELEALMGGLHSLDVITAIQVELSFVRVYQGGPLYQEVISFLEQHGFDLFSVSPAFIDGKSGRMLQVDGLFVRRSMA